MIIGCHSLKNYLLFQSFFPQESTPLKTMAEMGGHNKGIYIYICTGSYGYFIEIHLLGKGTVYLGHTVLLPLLNMSYCTICDGEK